MDATTTTESVVSVVDWRASELAEAVRVVTAVLERQEAYATQATA